VCSCERFGFPPIDILSLNNRALAAPFSVLHSAWLGSVPRLVFALWPVPVLARLRERFLATIFAFCYLPFSLCLGLPYCGLAFVQHHTLSTDNALNYLLAFDSQMPTDPVPPPLRPWREISRELANETNHNRIIELHYELNRALDEQLFRNLNVSSTL
jgi:hypothetical protein